MELTNKNISLEFKTKLWPLFEVEFAERQHTLKNYKNILQGFCEYIGKDFLQAREEDVANYYKFLNVKCELGNMSKRSMLTYQKTLRAIAYKVEEYIKQYDLTVFYLNVFKDTVAQDVRKLREDMWIILPEELSAMLTGVRNMREMVIMLMLAEGGLTAAQLKGLTWECMKIKAKGKWISYDEKHGFFMSEFFAMAWKDFMQESIVNHRYKPKGLLFTSNWGNPLDTKNISTLVKYLRKKAGIDREITARQLRDYALLLRLDDLLNTDEQEFNERVILDESQKTRMRELYQWMVREDMIETGN